ncbi:MAG TPA: lamin tail domain-containing protein [Methanotrichaceae archaeon]|nr:lamin tail domain-containing protein [Methanotrichaceae archaeon]
MRDHLNDEWVEITNQGTVTQDMDGWTLSDEGNHTYKFKNFILAPKASAKVHTGKGDNSATDIYWSRTSSVWNNDGDKATLKDASGNEVASHKEGKMKTKSIKAKKAPKA